MSGWSQTRAQAPQQAPQQAPPGVNRDAVAGRGNAAAIEAMFAEQDYGILSQSRLERAVVRNNSSALQHLPTVLSAFHLGPRETYDVEVVARIAEFQQNFGRRENANGIDGVVGPTTLSLLQSYYNSQDAGEVDASSIWPAQGATTEQQYEHFARLATLFGNAPVEGTALIIGIRGALEFAGATHEIKNIHAYDDTYVVLLKTADGAGVWTFSGATHAYQKASSQSPNADGRGRTDVGTVRPTHDGESYTLGQRRDYHGRTSLGLGSDPTQWGAGQTPDWWEMGMVPIDRDTNQDGTITTAEKQGSRDREPRRGTRDSTRQVLDGVGDYATVTWFHPGLTETKDSGAAFSSIACLTARAEDLENLDAIAGETNRDLTMIIVEAAEAARRMSGG